MREEGTIEVKIVGKRQPWWRRLFKMDEPKVEVKPVVIEEVKPKVDKDLIDAKTLVALIYLMYKMNVIDRYGVKNSLDILKGDMPDDILKYLMDETLKLQLR